MGLGWPAVELGWLTEALGWATVALGSVAAAAAAAGCDAVELGWFFGLCCWAMGLCFSELGADGGLLISGIYKTVGHKYDFLLQTRLRRCRASFLIFYHFLESLSNICSFFSPHSKVSC